MLFDGYEMSSHFVINRWIFQNTTRSLRSRVVVPLNLLLGLADARRHTTLPSNRCRFLIGLYSWYFAHAIMHAFKKCLRQGKLPVWIQRWRKLKFSPPWENSYRSFSFKLILVCILVYTLGLLFAFFFFAYLLTRFKNAVCNTKVFVMLLTKYC